ncbi:MAG: SpoIIE family protein phosphatase [Odoribacter sp.]|nr:SpoIIE family protein phosphatase [Odoribacter sp.]
MNIFSHFHFARKLIFHLFLASIIVFGLISWMLTHSVKRFISNHAYTQTQLFAENIQSIFEKEILKLENIPDKLIGASGCHSQECISALPETLLKHCPQLIGCSLHCHVTDPDTTPNHHLVAIRESNGKIRLRHPHQGISPLPVKQQIIRQTAQGYWIYSQVNQEKTLAFCYPLYDTVAQPLGFLKLDFPQKTITYLICNCHSYPNNKLFIIDSGGNYLVNPFQLENIHEARLPLFLKDNSYFIHYTPISCMNWQLGILCPSCSLTNSFSQLYWIVFLCLGCGFLVLFIGTANIVRRQSAPWKQLAHTAREIANGQFETPMPEFKYNHEIHEVCHSFRYLQHHLSDYIEKLKIFMAEQEQRKAELNLAQKIQQRFLPHNITLPPHIQLASELRQSREVGGDLYEYFISDNRLYFAIGDVTGKGIPAALYMASISKLLRYVACSQTSTAQICSIINKHMCEDGEDGMYITLFLGILNMNTGVLTYSNTGHPYPLIVHPDGSTQCLDADSGLPIGILDSYHFTEGTYVLSPNHSILLYTDGITDAENPAGQFFSKDRLIECVERIAPASPQQIIQAIMENITKHIGNGKQTDDLSLLLIRFGEIT